MVSNISYFSSIIGYLFRIRVRPKGLTSIPHICLFIHSLRSFITQGYNPGGKWGVWGEGPGGPGSPHSFTAKKSGFPAGKMAPARGQAGIIYRAHGPFGTKGPIF